jgi:redox-sensitive bicupin YhaK (pirin superfamily)
MTTQSELKSREVKRVDSPQFVAVSNVHRERLLVAPGNWGDTDPFILMGDVWYSHGAFDNHPHRGFETVTYVIEGAIAHYDNLGNKGTIGPTEVLWMTAGKGIVHNEIPVDEKPIHVLQLWVNLPKVDKLVNANYQELKKENTPRKKFPDAEIVVYSGTVGDLTAPTRNHAKVLMTEILLEANSTFAQELPADYNGFIVILSGKGSVGSNAVSVQNGDVAWLRHETTESKVRLESKDQPLRALIFAGKPLREPMVAKGPFVMNSEEEVRQASLDFDAAGDTFGR